MVPTMKEISRKIQILKLPYCTFLYLLITTQIQLGLGRNMTKSSDVEDLTTFGDSLISEMDFPAMTTIDHENTSQSETAPQVTTTEYKSDIDHTSEAMMMSDKHSTIEEKREKIDLYLLGLWPMIGVWPGGQGILPGALLALDQVNNDPTILPDYRLNMIWNDTEVSQSVVHISLFQI